VRLLFSEAHRAIELALGPAAHPLQRGAVAEIPEAADRPLAGSELFLEEDAHLGPELVVLGARNLGTLGSPAGDGHERVKRRRQMRGVLGICLRDRPGFLTGEGPVDALSVHHLLPLRDDEASDAGAAQGFFGRGHQSLQSMLKGKKHGTNI